MPGYLQRTVSMPGVQGSTDTLIVPSGGLVGILSGGADRFGSSRSLGEVTPRLDFFRAKKAGVVSYIRTICWRATDRKESIKEWDR